MNFLVYNGQILNLIHILKFDKKILNFDDIFLKSNEQKIVFYGKNLDCWNFFLFDEKMLANLDKIGK